MLHCLKTTARTTVRTLAFAALVAVPALSTGPAPAASGSASWYADRDASRLAFVYERGGEAAEGSFSRFTARGAFDPERPREARLELRIRTESIDLGSRVESAFATSVEWFDSKAHPVAVYRLETLEPLGGDLYRAFGTLTIKGRERALVTDIALAMEETPEGVRARASGRLEIDRRPFGLGVGPMAAFVTLGDTVEVAFDISAFPEP